MLPFVIVNGSPAESVSVYDRAFQYGDGVFETIAVVDGNPAQLKAHLDRLETGLDVLNIRGIDISKLAQDITRYSGQFDSAVLKVIVSRGESQRGYVATGKLSPNIVFSFSEKDFQQDSEDLSAITVRLCETSLSLNKKLAGIKHLNRLEQVLARNEWRAPEITEGLMRDTSGNIIEATAANVFLWKDRQLMTPDLTECGVAGTVRKLVIDMAETLSIPCKIRKLGVDACHQADAMFLTNALTGVQPVRKFESTVYGTSSWPRELFNKVMQHVFT